MADLSDSDSFKAGKDVEGRAAAIRDLAYQVAGQIVGAGVGLEGSAWAVLLGAASAPLVSAAAARVTERRMAGVQRSLDAAGLGPEETLRRILQDAPSLDLFRAAVRAAINSDLEAKRIALGESLARGLLSGDAVAVNLEIKLTKTLDRLEAPEIGVLSALERESYSGKRTAQAGAVSYSRLVTEFSQMAAFLDAVLAPLEAEGLVRRSGGGIEAEWLITDYGLELLSILRRAGGAGPDQPSVL